MVIRITLIRGYSVLKLTNYPHKKETCIMKKLILSLFVVMLFASVIEAQSTITVIATISGGGSSVAQKKVVKNKQTTTTYELGTSSIGMIFTQSDSTTLTFRSYYEFSLYGIPTDATIQEVTVNFNNGNSSSYSFKLTQVTSVSTDKGANCRWKRNGLA